MKVDLSIKGIQKAQGTNARAIAALRPRGELGRALQYAVAETHRYAVSITHVRTGALRASHRMAVNLRQMQGRVYLSPSATNPRSGTRTAEYGAFEEERGGEHAFYARTRRERGKHIAARGIAIIEKGLP